MKNLTKNSNVIYRHLRELGVVNELDRCVECSKTDDRKLLLLRQDSDIFYIRANDTLTLPRRFVYSVISRERPHKLASLISLDSTVYNYFPEAYTKILKKVVEQGNGDVNILDILSDECGNLFSMIVCGLANDSKIALNNSLFKIACFSDNYVIFSFTDDTFNFMIYYPINYKKDNIITRFTVGEKQDYFDCKYDESELKEIVHHVCSELNNQFKENEIPRS